MKIVNIVGARPQFIKYFPVSKALERFNKLTGTALEDVLIHTGQHYDYSMSKIFFDEFGIKEPGYHLGVGSGPHGEQTGQIIQKVEDVLKKEKPDVVLVYGDTNSTLGGALASTKLHIPVAHVEAGLRSYNKYMPEEINRILADHVSTFLFCPSITAVRNLIGNGYKNILNGGELIPSDYFMQTEGIMVDNNNPLVINVGDVMYDVLIYAVKIAEGRSKILEQLQIDGRNFYMLTLHRFENTDNQERLEEIIDFVNDVSRGKIIIFPMHPRTKKVYKNVRREFANNIKIIEPLGYFDTLMLLKNSDLLMTDSGGMQKEAYLLRIPTITLRDETEWVETIQSGWNVLWRDYKGMHKPLNADGLCYGDGITAERIVSLIVKWLKK